LSHEQTGVLSSPPPSSEQRRAEGGLQLGQWGRLSPTGPVRRGLRLRGGSFFSDMSRYFGVAGEHQRGCGMVGHCTLGALRPILPKCPHANCGKRVPNQPLRPRRGRFGKLWGQLQSGSFGRTAVKQRITVYPSQEPQEDGSVGFGRDPNVLPRFRISNTVALSQYAYTLTYTHVHRQGALQRLWTRRTTDAGASVASRRTPQAPAPDDGA